MAEIIVLWILCKRISEIARARKRDPGSYRLLLIALWFGGEIAGFVIGLALTGSANIIAYITGLIGAAVSSAIAFKRATRRNFDLPPTPGSQTKSPI
jgi:membrane associated rhomboid family serine protease